MDISNFKDKDEIVSAIGQESKIIRDGFEANLDLNIDNINKYISSHASKCFRIIRSIDTEADIINKLVVKLTEYYADSIKNGNKGEATEKIKLLIGKNGIFPEFRRIIVDNTKQLENRIQSQSSKIDEIRLMGRYADQNQLREARSKKKKTISKKRDNQDLLGIQFGDD